MTLRSFFSVNENPLLARLLFALAFLTLFLMVTIPAWAQEAASTVIDAGPLIEGVVAFLVPTILTVASALSLWVLERLARWLGLGIDQRHRAAVEQGLERAVRFATEKVGDRVRGGIPIDMRHTAIAHAAAYAQNRIPDALAHFKVTPQSLAEMVEARLDGLIVDPKAEDAAGTISGRLVERPGPLPA